MLAFPMLKAQKGINFIGNVEGRDLFNDKVDVARTASRYCIVVASFYKIYTRY